MEKIRIEKGIPMPSNGLELPFSEMNVGDSFLIPKEVSAITVRVRAVQYCTDNVSNVKFSIKKVDNGYRCWRIK